MTENRRQVLEMLSAGQINTDEADRLIAALDDGAAAATAAVEPRRTSAPKYLRVLVDAEDDDGPLKVNVRVPLQLLRAGVRLASLIPPQAQDEVNDALRVRGVALDLSQIKPENIDELIDQLGELTVNVDQEQKLKVRVFCE